MKILHLFTLTVLVVTIGCANARTSKDLREPQHHEQKSTNEVVSLRLSYSQAVGKGYSVSGMTRYLVRFYGSKDYQADPTVCFSTVKATFGNSGGRQSLGYYICPYSRNDSSTATSCCGPPTQQTCCDPQKATSRDAVDGMVAESGVIVAVTLVSLTVIIIISWFVSTKREKKLKADIDH